MSQAPYERLQLAKYAQEYRLLVSQGSDFHQPCAWVESWAVSYSCQVVSNQYGATGQTV